jgi:hypothetical protein
MSYSAKGLYSMGNKKGVIISAILIITLAACASIQNKQAAKTEDVLVKAGFRKVPADTPEQLAHLQTIPQRELVRHKHKDGIRYIYADANLCKCMYVGDRDAYQSYKHILLEKEIKGHEHVEGEPLTYQQMDWDLWGDFTSAPGHW